MPRYFPPTTMEITLEKVSSQWVPHHFSKERSIKDAINTYKLASYCGALKKEKPIILAGICLRIAWLYRIKPKQGTRRKIFKFAIEEYEASYSTGDFSGTQLSEARILYLGGEISRKIGNEKAAIKFFHSCPKKMPGKPLSSRWPDTAFRNSNGPRKQSTLCCSTDKKRAVPPGTAFYPP